MRHKICYRLLDRCWVGVC